VEVERPQLFEIAQTCLEVGVDGHRGDIIMLKTAKTLAALDGRTSVESTTSPPAPNWSCRTGSGGSR
jgi:magnesium chelatase subunit I